MTVLEAIILGLVQGIAEFLPISSSGHLSVIQNIQNELNMQPTGEGHLFFDVLLHFGTLVSVCIFYWRDIKSMALEVIELIRSIIDSIRGKRVRVPRAAAGNRETSSARRLLLLIIIGTLPLLVILPLKSYVEELYYNTFFIGIMFLLTGAMLYVSDKLSQGIKTAKTMSGTNALLVGVCQAVAVIPGLSRSGTTITAGLANGLSRETAVQYSFLMSLPAIVGATILEVVDAIKEGVDVSNLPMYFLGMIVAAVVGYIAIGLVRMIVRKGKFGYFAYYCAFAGVATIILYFIF